MKNLIIFLLILCGLLYSEVSYEKIYGFESDGQSFNTKNFFYDNGEEVVVFDTHFTPEVARKSIEYIRTQTNNPITYAVVTHPNPDKFNGVIEFQKIGAKVIASQQTVASMPGVHEYKKYYFVHIAKMFTEETYPTMPTIDIVFHGSYKIILANGETIQLHELDQAGISSNQTIAIIPNKAMFVGDLIHHNAHAWLEGGIIAGNASATIESWIGCLRTLETLSSSNIMIYGGRGEAANAKVAITQQIAYLKKAQQIVADYIAKLGAKKQELKGDQAGKHYLAIQKIFETTFPEYQLSYMIQFGVYGLINHLLEN